MYNPGDEVLVESDSGTRLAAVIINEYVQDSHVSYRVQYRIDNSTQVVLENQLCPILESPTRFQTAELKTNPSSQERKNTPLFSGVLMYFPDALLEVARHSKRGNDKHNPGKPLHWAKEKSADHADCIARHLTDIGPNWDNIDEDTQAMHAVALAWRSLALLQTVLDRKKRDK